MKGLPFRLIFVLVSGVFAFLLFSTSAESLNDLFYRLTEDSFPIFLKFDTRERVVLIITSFWIFFHFILELTASFSKNVKFKGLLTHFRFAPAAIFLVSIFVIPLYDAGMIAYSRQNIRNYVFSNSEELETMAQSLRSNYRSWCGNGYFANRSYYYYETAAEELNNENPNIRARALLATNSVADVIINGNDRERFDRVLSKSCQDSSEIVRNVAEGILTDRNQTCQKFIVSE